MHTVVCVSGGGDDGDSEDGEEVGDGDHSLQD